MTNEEAKKEIRDYCNRQGRFQEAREMVGMEASEIPALFISYFDKLGRDDQLVLVEALVQTAIGQSDGLSDCLPVAILTLSRLCAERRDAGVSRYLALLEREFSDPQ